jgi:hypothetical protein
MHCMFRNQVKDKQVLAQMQQQHWSDRCQVGQ